MKNEGPRFQPYSTLGELDQATATKLAAPHVVGAIEAAGGYLALGELQVILPNGLTTAVPASGSIGRQTPEVLSVNG